MPESPVDRVRSVCLSLPNVEERLSHGEPTWFYKCKRSFAMFANHHHDDRVAVWCAAALGAQEMLVQAEPSKFFRPPYVGPRGWIGIWLDVEQDWDEVQGLLEAAYQSVAAKKR